MKNICQPKRFSFDVGFREAKSSFQSIPLGSKVGFGSSAVQPWPLEMGFQDAGGHRSTSTSCRSAPETVE